MEEIHAHGARSESNATKFYLQLWCAGQKEGDTLSDSSERFYQFTKHNEKKWRPTMSFTVKRQPVTMEWICKHIQRLKSPDIITYHSIDD